MTRIIIENGNLFDAINGNFIENQTVVIENKKISYVGDSYDKQSDDQIINAENKFLLPGLMDIHLHLSAGFEWILQPEKTMLRMKDQMVTYLALKHAQTYIVNGFTTLRDCGSFGNNWGPSLRRVFERGMFTGPRLFVSNDPIAQYGNQEAFGPSLWIKAQEEYESVSGVDDVIRAVRNRRSTGADFIKTMTTGGVLHGQDSKVKLSLWMDEELEAMVHEAERLGMYVAAHAHGEYGINRAINAGVRTIEHASMIAEEDIKELIKRKGFIVPTQSAMDIFKHEAVIRALPPEVKRKGELVSKTALKQHKLAFQLGAQIALGTDAPVGGDHFHSANELEHYVKNIGMTSEQAIQAGTIVAARAIGQEDNLGSITEGKLADIVILDKDPREDIAVFKNTQLISNVIKDGKIVASRGKLL